MQYCRKCTKCTSERGSRLDGGAGEVRVVRADEGRELRDDVAGVAVVDEQAEREDLGKLTR